MRQSSSGHSNGLYPLDQDNGPQYDKSRTPQIRYRYKLRVLEEAGDTQRYVRSTLSTPAGRLSIYQIMGTYLANQWLVEAIVDRVYKDETSDGGPPRGTAALGQTCHTFYNLCMDVIWRQQKDLVPLFMCLPKDIWVVRYSKTRGREYESRWDGTMVSGKLPESIVDIH